VTRTLAGAGWHRAGVVKIDVDGDSASAFTRYEAMDQNGELCRRRYEDTYVRGPQGWRIASRKVVIGKRIPGEGSSAEIHAFEEIRNGRNEYVVIVANNPVSRLRQAGQTGVGNPLNEFRGGLRADDLTLLAMKEQTRHPNSRQRFAQTLLVEIEGAAGIAVQKGGIPVPTPPTVLSAKEIPLEACQRPGRLAMGQVLTDGARRGFQ